MTAHREAMRGFLSGTPWAKAKVTPLAGDASARRYFRLHDDRSGSAIVMDADPANGIEVAPFQTMTHRLRGLDLSAPEVLHADPGTGFLLLEDMGDALFAQIAQQDPQVEQTLYACATDLLIHLHQQPAATEGLKPYDRATLVREALLALEWYAYGATGQTPSKAPFEALIAAAHEALAGPVVCTLRDYHAENLVWLPDRKGLARCGLLDYQDALAGHSAYDLVSLLEDARRDTPAALRAAMIARYLEGSGARPEAFHAAYATLGAQRNLKILGLFVRLWLRDGKPQYLDLLPRVWNHLQRDLQAPHLHGLREWVEAELPAPDATIRARLRSARDA